MDQDVINKLLEDDEDDHEHAGDAVDAMTAALNQDIGQIEGMESVGTKIEDVPKDGVTTEVAGIRNLPNNCSSSDNLQVLEEFSPMETASLEEGKKAILVQAKSKLKCVDILTYLRPLVSSEQWEQLGKLYEQVKTSEISQDEFVRTVRVITGEPVLWRAIKAMQDASQLRTSQVQDSSEKENQTQAQSSMHFQGAAQDMQTIRKATAGKSVAKQEIDNRPISSCSAQDHQMSSTSFHSTVQASSHLQLNGENQVLSQSVPSEVSQKIKSETDVKIKKVLEQEISRKIQIIAQTQTQPAVSIPLTTSSGTHVVKKETVEINLSHNQWSQGSHVHTITHDACPEDDFKGSQQPLNISKQQMLSASQQVTVTGGRSSSLDSAVLSGTTGGAAILSSASHMTAFGNGSMIDNIAGQGKSITGLSASLASLNAVLQNPQKLIGQKKPADDFSVGQPPSKKQKMIGSDPQQSIEQLNDVTAVSGVNLREEEEQLLAGPRTEVRSTEAIKRYVQEEEDRFFLEKGPLRAKLNAIARKSGIKGVNEDAERCLSMSVEELLWRMMYKLVKISKQHHDMEKTKHEIKQTTNIRNEVNLIVKQANELMQKKQAEESERLRLNERMEKGLGADGKDTTAKAAKHQDEDKMRTNAANLVTRAAVGGDDMLLKWQMMAEQGRQRRQGDTVVTNGSAMRDQEKGAANVEPDSSLPVNRMEVEGSSNMAKVSGYGQVHGRPLPRRSLPQPAKVSRSITIKDVIAYFELEPTLSRSSVLLRLYERN